jgi:hypothetical protein
MRSRMDTMSVAVLSEAEHVILSQRWPRISMRKILLAGRPIRFSCKFWVESRGGAVV